MRSCAGQCRRKPHAVVRGLRCGWAVLEAGWVRAAGAQDLAAEAPDAAGGDRWRGGRGQPGRAGAVLRQQRVHQRGAAGAARRGARRSHRPAGRAVPVLQARPRARALPAGRCGSSIWAVAVCAAQRCCRGLRFCTAPAQPHSLPALPASPCTSTTATCMLQCFAPRELHAPGLCRALSGARGRGAAERTRTACRRWWAARPRTWSAGRPRSGSPARSRVRALPSRVCRLCLHGPMP